jgi:hypothetical protein
MYIWLMGHGHGLKHFEQLRQKSPLLLEGPPQAEFLTFEAGMGEISWNILLETGHMFG